jgi:hypothetical protein
MAKVSATLSKTRSVYARDFFAWTQQQAGRLRRAAVREPAPDLGLAPIARDSGQRSGKRFHMRRARSAPGALPASARRGMLPRRHDGQVPGSAGRRQTVQSGAYSDHAKAHHPRQCPDPRRPHVVAITRLTKTDTLAAPALRPHPQFTTCHWPSGVRQAVPYTSLLRPPICAWCWNSRQYVPPALSYVSIGVTLP